MEEEDPQDNKNDSKSQKILKTEEQEDFKAFKLLCNGCLSIGRTVFAGGKFTDLLVKICGVSDNDLKNMHFCWECMALLQKVAIFKKKFDIAQRSFAEHEFSSVCLSTLAIENINIEKSITIVYNEEVSIEENPMIIDVKTETKDMIEASDIDDIYKNECSINDNCDLVDFFDEEPICKEENISDEYLKELKDIQLNSLDEIKPNVKKVKKKKPQIPYTVNKKPYQIIPKDKNNADYITKEKINPEDLNDWIDEERNSRYFRMLSVKCDKCVIEVSQKEDHEILHDKNSGPLNCAICECYFSNEDEFSKHVLKHYFIHKCTICDFRCYSSNQMVYHLQFHNQRVHCLQCGAGFKDVREFYKHHKKLHILWICDICNKQFKHRHVIVKHMRVHFDKYCKICKITFKSHKTFNDHTKAIHTENVVEEAFCVKCDRQFKNVYLYKRHLSYSVAHEEERSYKRRRENVKCLECPNVYARREYMMNHYNLVHLKVSNFYCSDCDKYYLNRFRYNEHRKYVHEGKSKKKDKLCITCGRAFACRRTLVNHIRTHSGERPFACPHCDSKFTQETAMLTHVKFIHLKLKRNTKKPSKQNSFLV